MPEAELSPSPSAPAFPAALPTPVPDLIPARMLNEFTYCPRLAYLEWVQGEWAESTDTLEGAHVHRRVDEPQGERAVLHTRSLQLSSERLGLTAVIDLVERDGRRARPVDYKRGRKPAVAEGAWEPERVQLCAQGLLLREHGYECNEGLLYFAGSREKVRIRFTAALVDRTLALARAMRETLAAGLIPPPLEDSPKCPRCSLVSICLPEEVNFLRRGGEVRPIAVADPETHPLIVQQPGAYVRLCGSRLLVQTRGEADRSVPLLQVSELVLMSNTQCTGPVVRECCGNGIPIVYMSGTGWLIGITRGASHKNVELRAEQFAAARDEERRLAFARSIVAVKIANCRVLLRRNGNPESRDLELLRGFAGAAEASGDVESLLGIEGNAAKIYYGNLPSMLKCSGQDLPAFDFAGRNRRPPRDPINAMLSFAYALLTKDWTLTLEAVGLDPLMGFYHRPRYGKPALALDLMEPFRPVIADSVVIGAINNGEIGAGDFFAAEGGVLIRPTARKRLVEAYERRMTTETRHPLFGYACTYRRLFEIEARLVGRWITGEIPVYEPFRIR